MANNSSLQTAIAQAADVLHEQWRESYRAANGDKPRWKPLKDASIAWVEQRSDIPASALKEEEGKKFIDIAALPNSKLPPQYSGENTAAAKGAVEAIAENPRAGMEAFAAVVHTQWVGRNESWAPAELKVPYAELPEVEKEKDRVIIRVAAAAVLDNRALPLAPADSAALAQLRPAP